MLYLARDAVPHKAIRQNYYTVLSNLQGQHDHIKPHRHQVGAFFVREQFLFVNTFLSTFCSRRLSVFANTFCSFSKRANKKKKNNNIASFRTFEHCSRSKKNINIIYSLLDKIFFECQDWRHTKVF